MKLAEPDHRWHTKGGRSGVDEQAVGFLSGGDALDHQHYGAADGRYVNGLIRGVQNEHRRLHHPMRSLRTVGHITFVLSSRLSFGSTPPGIDLSRASPAGSASSYLTSRDILSTRRVWAAVP